MIVTNELQHLNDFSKENHFANKLIEKQEIFIFERVKT